MRPLSFLALLALASCSSQISAVSGQFANVKMNVEQIHDLEAQVLQSAACNTTVGTLKRNNTGNPNFGAGVDLLCPAAQPVALPTSMVAPH